MGVFDYLRCEYGEVPDLEYQFKDMDAPYLEHYKIDKDGQLWHEYCEYSFEPDESKEGIMQFIGAMKTTFSEWRKVDDYRGEIRFYTDHKGEWLEFSALLDGGKVQSIKQRE